MNIVLNWLAILTATISGMVVAGLWYSKIFANTWRKLTGVSEADSKKAGKTPMIILFVSNLLTAIGLNFIISISKTYYNVSYICFALIIGFILWLGFSATTLIQHNTFEQKPSKLTWINNAYQLALFMVMAFVIGLFG